LAVVKSKDINIIGQNFMTGYSIVFDREKMVLGWEASNCYGIENSTSPESSAPESSAPESSAVPPTALNPEATTKVSPTSGLSPNDSTRLKSSISTLFAVIFTALIHCLIIGSS
jgi:hypothetical protein